MNIGWIFQLVWVIAAEALTFSHHDDRARRDSKILIGAIMFFVRLPMVILNLWATVVLLVTSFMVAFWCLVFVVSLCGLTIACLSRGELVDPRPYMEMAGQIMSRH